jgi:plastocyanin domain-containing protein
LSRRPEVIEESYVEEETKHRVKTVPKTKKVIVEVEQQLDKFMEIAKAQILEEIRSDIRD